MRWTSPATAPRPSASSAAAPTTSSAWTARCRLRRLESVEQPPRSPHLRDPVDPRGEAVVAPLRGTVERATFLGHLAEVAVRAPGDAHWLFQWAEVGDYVWVHDPSGLTPTDPDYYGPGAP